MAERCEAKGLNILVSKQVIADVVDVVDVVLQHDLVGYSNIIHKPRIVELIVLQMMLLYNRPYNITLVT